MVELNLSEKNEVMRLSSKFISIHTEIRKIESEISDLQKKANLLIEKLESCRLEEQRFSKSLEEKYGPGNLDPLHFLWQKSNFSYESEN